MRSRSFVFVCISRHLLIVALRQHREGEEPDGAASVLYGRLLPVARRDTVQIDMQGEEAKMMDGHWTKCCCRSDVISQPERSTQVMCELVPAEPKNYSRPFRDDYVDFLGCKQLKGNGYHSWNNMPGKYDELNNSHQCITTVTTTMLIIDFEGHETKRINGRLDKCCCRSEILSNPEDSTKIVCELSPVTWYWGICPPWVRWCHESNPGCKSLRGPGYHSWNNMGEKYAALTHYNECAVSALPEKTEVIYKDGPMNTNECPKTWARVLTQSACEAAAYSLYRQKFSGIKSDSTKPAGCYVERYFKPWGIVEEIFLNEVDELNSSNSVTAKPICQSIVPSTD